MKPCTSPTTAKATSRSCGEDTMLGLDRRSASAAFMSANVFLSISCALSIPHLTNSVYPSRQAAGWSRYTLTRWINHVGLNRRAGPSIWRLVPFPPVSCQATMPVAQGFCLPSPAVAAPMHARGRTDLMYHHPFGSSIRFQPSRLPKTALSKPDGRWISTPDHGGPRQSAALAGHSAGCGLNTADRSGARNATTPIVPSPQALQRWISTSATRLMKSAASSIATGDGVGVFKARRARSRSCFLHRIAPDSDNTLVRDGRAMRVA